MADTNNDGFDLGSGLPLADAEVTVSACEFGYNPNIGGGTVVCANFTFIIEESGEEAEQSFSVGNGFEPLEKGQLLASEDGRARKISGQSNYGRLLGSIIEAVGGREKVEQTGVNAFQAGTWVGTKWTTGTKKVVVRNPTTDKETERDAIVFVEFRGRDGAAAAPKAAGKAKAAAADLTEHPLWEQLVELAGKHDDHDDFMEAAMEVEGVEGDKAITGAIISTKAGSIWATAKG